MATMKQIAQLSGVSVATVSYVLSGKKNVNDDTRLRVLQAVELTNYKPNAIAKSLRMNKTHIIGVLVEDICGLPVPEIVDGINERLEQSGYQVLLSNLRLLNKLYNQYEQLSQHIDTFNNGIRLLEDARVDGIIYVAMHDRSIEGIHQPVGIPMVLAFAESADGDCASVTYDNENSARQITELLITQGHKRIALVAGHPNSQPSRQRLAGYHAAMESAGLPVPAEYIRWGDWEYHSGASQAGALMSLSIPPTAIFAMNDSMAAGCYAAIQRKGLAVPGDISVVGFDNRELAASLYPALTTVALPNKQIGRTAADHLLMRLGNQPAPATTVLPCSIIRRDSTARR